MQYNVFDILKRFVYKFYVNLPFPIFLDKHENLSQSIDIHDIHDIYFFELESNGPPCNEIPYIIDSNPKS